MNRLPRLLLALATCACAATWVGCTRSPTVDELVSSARDSLDKKDTKTALVQLKSALQLDPKSAKARFLMGSALLNSGSPVVAIVELEKAIELNHPQNEVVPLLAKVLLGTGQARKVTDRFDSTALDDPKAQSDLKSTLAAAFLVQGMRERCEAAVEAALALDPKNDAARLIKARQTAAKGRMDEAIQILDSVLADSPNLPQAWHLKGEVLWIGKGDAFAGAKAFDKSLEVSPSFLLGHTSLISLALQAKDSRALDVRVDALKRALPGHPEARFFEGQRALMRGDAKTAREVAQLLLKGAPNNVRVLQLAGAVELAGGSSILAVTHLTKALQFEPRAPIARRLLAQAHLRSGEPARALAALQPMIEQTAPQAESLALAAEAYLQNGQFAQSEALYRRASKLAPEDPKIRTALAMAQISKGNTEAGFADLEALAAKDMSSNADYALISAQLRRNDLDAAIRAVDRLSQKLPEGALPHYLRAQILLRRKDASSARASLEKSLAADGSYLPAAAALVSLDVEENKLDKAISRLEQRLQREPKDFQALTTLVQLKQRTGTSADSVQALVADAVKGNPGEALPRVMLVDLLLARRELNAAKTAAQEGLAALTNHPALLDALGRVQLAAGESQQATASFGKVVAAQPASVLAHLRMAEAQLQNKDTQAAVRSLQRALEIDPKAVAAQARLLKVAIAEKRVDDALNMARVVQKQRPTEAVGFLLEGELFAERKQWAPALAAFQAALARDKSLATAVRLHASMLRAGKKGDAESFAKSWLKESPNDIAFLMHLGATALENKDFASAETHYRGVLAGRSNDAVVLNDLAWVLLRQGKPGALEYAERANQLAKDQSGIMDTLAEALAVEGRLPDALTWQRKAVDKANEVSAPYFRFRLAKLQLKAGDQAAARAELDKLTYMGEKFAQQAELAELLRTLK